jgi:hypothetical protein
VQECKLVSSDKRQGLNKIKGFEFKFQTVQPNLTRISFKLSKHIINYYSYIVATTMTPVMSQPSSLLASPAQEVMDDAPVDSPSIHLYSFGGGNRRQ